MLIFIILMPVITHLGDARHPRTGNGEPRSEIAQQLDQRLGRDKSFVEKIAKERPRLYYTLAFTTLAGGFILFLGMLFLIIFFTNWFAGRQAIKPVVQQHVVPWGLLDVIRVVILFVFIGYILLIAESVIFKALNIKEYDRNLTGIFNTTILDLCALFCIVYFIKVKFRQGLSSLGLVLKGFFKSVYTGIVSYITLIPVLFLAVLLVVLAASIFKYKPPTEPIIEMLFDEKRSRLLAYMTFFVSIGGPIVEEIFFRGFLYSAMKKVMNMKLAIFISAALFSLLHTNVIGFLPILCLGALLAYVYEKTGSLISSITIHIIHNSIVLFLIFLIKEIIR